SCSSPLPLHDALPIFGADHLAVAGAADRLVHHADLAALPCAAQLLLQVRAALDRVVHGPAVEAEAVLARGLGLVHGDVAVLHQRSEEHTSELQSRENL